MRLIQSLLLVLLLWPLRAEAQKVYSTTLGDGNSSCQTWTKVRTEDPDGADARALVGWVLGFLSGHNTYSGGDRVVTRTMAVSVDSWIDKYCEDRPSATIALAAMQFPAKKIELKLEGAGGRNIGR